MADLLLSLGWVLLGQGELTEARRLTEAGVAAHRALGDPRGLANGLFHLGGVLTICGELLAGRAALREALGRYAALGVVRGVYLCLDFLAVNAAASGEPELATRLWGAAEGRRDQTGAILALTFRQYNDRFAPAARAALTPAAWDAVWAAGRALALDETVAFGLG